MTEKRILSKCPICGKEVRLIPDTEMRCRHCGNRIIKKIPQGKSSFRGIPRSIPHHRSPSLRSKDSVRFRTGAGGFGIGGAQRGEQSRELDAWQTPVRRAGTRSSRQTVGRFPRKPEYDVFHNQKSYQVIIYDLPFRGLEDVRCEVTDDVLVVESLIDGFEFLQKFSLPEDVLHNSIEVSLKNSVLDICFLYRKL